MKILGIGNALVDVLVRLDDEAALTAFGLEKGGMVLLGDAEQRRMAPLMQALAPQKATGGSASNVILALSHLQGGTGFVGCVGDDADGRFFAQTLRSAGAEMRLRTVCHQATGTANTFITPDGERTFGTHLGAACALTADEIAPGRFAGFDLLHIEGYLIQDALLIETICRTAKELGMTVSLDLASYTVVRDHRAEMQRLVRQYVDIVFANQEESVAYTGLADAQAAAAAMAQDCALAVVKMGAEGACAVRGGQRPVVVGAKRVKVADTTAAGDFFAAGFLHAYGCGASLERCLSCGALLAGEVIQVIGTQVADSTWQRLQAELSDLGAAQADGLSAARNSN